ncbi:MAG: hypothetical protein BJ554DRAFT_3763 [Olpidium bornovanus]|uniref:Uncharacterized protein n=1 Tax=Olpidium bornovanus TaxID=278681 RepID=A0A8H8DFQ1_9FUNG|nr:MAG: hypothetical protein BJ554DRAFT_3763 [Olpidium bornovanus]
MAQAQPKPPRHPAPAAGGGDDGGADAAAAAAAAAENERLVGDNQVAEEDRHKCSECLDFDLFRADLLRNTCAALLPCLPAALQTALLSQEEHLVVHNNVWCDLCQKVITGPRFKCAKCKQVSEYCELIFVFSDSDSIEFQTHI